MVVQKTLQPLSARSTWARSSNSRSECPASLHQQVRPLHRRRTVLTRWSRGDEVMEEVESPLTDELVSGLAALDDTIMMLQMQLEESEAAQADDAMVIARLVKEVQLEQEAWVKETQAVEKLMEAASGLNASQEDVAALEKRYEVMKRKIELFNGVLNERKREISDLQRQMENVKQMGEMKRMKENLARASQRVAVGSVAIASEEMDAPSSMYRTSSPASVGFVPSSSQGHILGDSGFSGSSFPAVQVPRDILSLKGKSAGMESPGLVVAALVVAIAELTEAAWNALQRKMPSKVRLLLEIILACGAALGGATCVSTINF